ncbi:MAG: NAD(P)H-dependent glycerol-3-phosphate dehydrogenase, partial [Patescibacteria group bacterium]
QDVAEKKPTAVNLAGSNKEAANDVIKAFRNETFHFKYSSDVIGTELCAVMKNVVAIASGMALGVGYGPNTQALLVVEGINEMMALGKAVGAKPETFLGLAGLGDLLLTAMNEKSRNMHFGMELGKGMNIDEALQHQKGVAEGYYTLLSIDYLLQKYNLSLPLSRMLMDILIKKIPLKERLDQYLKELYLYV